VKVIFAVLLVLTFVPGLLAQIPGQVPASAAEDSLEDAERFAARPIPRAFKIGAALLLVVAAGAGAYFAVRTWRFSNLFDRQYVLPPAREATLRLGGNRSGGCMATINFAAAPTEPPLPVTPQKPEETPPP
jgi:hypothetical protein